MLWENTNNRTSDDKFYKVAMRTYSLKKIMHFKEIIHRRVSSADLANRALYLSDKQSKSDSYPPTALAHNRPINTALNGNRIHRGGRPLLQLHPPHSRHFINPHFPAVRSFFPGAKSAAAQQRGGQLNFWKIAPNKANSAFPFCRPGEGGGNKKSFGCTADLRGSGVLFPLGVVEGWRAARGIVNETRRTYRAGGGHGEWLVCAAAARGVYIDVKFRVSKKVGFPPCMGSRSMGRLFYGSGVFVFFFFRGFRVARLTCVPWISSSSSFLMCNAVSFLFFFPLILDRYRWNEVISLLQLQN